MERQVKCASDRPLANSSASSLNGKYSFSLDSTGWTEKGSSDLNRVGLIAVCRAVAGAYDEYGRGPGFIIYWLLKGSLSSPVLRVQRPSLPVFAAGGAGIRAGE